MSAKFKALRWILALSVLLLVLTGSLKVEKGRAGLAVDLVLVIALDVSASVDGYEYEFMLGGLSKALSSPAVALAVSAGKHGAIAISVLQWSGFMEQEIKIKWKRVAGANDLRRLAGRVRVMKRRYDGGATDIGGCISFSAELVKSAPFNAARKIIDIVGDGPNNVNYSPRRERDRAVNAGIVINALAITGGYGVLAGYFANLVIGGEGAFVEQADDFDGFERAIHRKLVREIGSLYLF